MNTSVAVFDLDGTLLKGDSFVRFLLACIIRFPGRAVRCIHLPVATVVFLTGARDNAWLKGVFLRAIVGGLRRDQIAEVVEAFVEQQLAKYLKGAGLAEVRLHQKQGTTVVLASASPDLYVKEIAAQLDIEHVISTVVEWRSGICLGRLNGDNCYGESKLAAIKKRFSHISYAYSDHDSDLPMLLDATWAVAVDPNHRLQKLSILHNLEVHRWD